VRVLNVLDAYFLNQIGVVVLLGGISVFSHFLSAPHMV
jgi:hypothetical protein